MAAHGINRLSPCAALYGPKLYDGLEFFHSHTKQTQLLIINILAKIRAGSDIGKLYISCLSQAQLLLRLETPILEDPNQGMRHLTDPWISHVVCSLKLLDATIKIPTLKRFPLARIRDQFLMQLAHSVTDAPIKLHQFQACCLFLQVLRVSNITTADGNSILITAWKGQSVPSTSIYEWPRQENPPIQCWKVWRTILHATLL